VRSDRFFVAINLPESVRETLVDIDPHVSGVRWTSRDQMHLTLGFFAHVPSDIEVALRERLSAIEFGAFFLPIKSIGTFPSKGSPKIVWIGIGSGHPHLFQIHKRVQEAAIAVGLEPDLRVWHPHITLARCQSFVGGSLTKFLKGNTGLDLGMTRVDAFHLYRSELTSSGPIHTCELTIPAKH
jgi:2'-5' RNA ligase